LRSLTSCCGMWQFSHFAFAHCQTRSRRACFMLVRHYQASRDSSGRSGGDACAD
jgi:hypothetical protein